MWFNIVLNTHQASGCNLKSDQIRILEVGDPKFEAPTQGGQAQCSEKQIDTPACSEWHGSTKERLHKYLYTAFNTALIATQAFLLGRCLISSCTSLPLAPMLLRILLTQFTPG